MSRKYKAKVKGVEYIAKTIRKYGSKEKFPTQASALKKARSLKKKIKGKVTVKKILLNIREKRRKKFKREILPPALTDVTPYYDLNSYTSIIETQVSNKVTFVSKLFPSDGESLEPMKGGYSYSYDLYFAPFVKFCDKARAFEKQQSGQETPSGEIKWHVRCLPVDKKNVSRIISCTSDGVEVSFGFNANQSDYIPKTNIAERKKTTTQKSKEVESKISASVEIEREKTKQLEIIKETEKIKTISEAMKMLREGIITKEQFDLIIKR